MTEEEALMKGCPYRMMSEENEGTTTLAPEIHQVDIPIPDGIGARTRRVWQPTGEVHPHCRCLGSKCMAWSGTGCLRLHK
jgi:hypothetical protein